MKGHLPGVVPPPRFFPIPLFAPGVWFAGKNDPGKEWGKSPLLGPTRFFTDPVLARTKLAVWVSHSTRAIGARHATAFGGQNAFDSEACAATCSNSRTPAGRSWRVGAPKWNSGGEGVVGLGLG